MLQIQKSASIQLIFILIVTVILFGCNTPVKNNVVNLQTAKLFVELPDYCPTPDAFDIAPDGSLTLSCPNYVDKNKPPVLVKITQNGVVSKLAQIPGLTDSTWARPVGIAYALDGSLFVADNQGKQQARLLRLTFNENGRLDSTQVVAYGLNSPNGVRFYNGGVYVTQPKLPKIKTEKLTSGVYRFNETDRDVKVNNDSTDANLIFTSQTQNPNRQFGLDGLVFDAAGDLLVGDFGDGTIYKLSLSDEGEVKDYEIFAQLPDSAGIDGMCFDEHENLYIAGFSQNQIYKITKDKNLSVIAQYPDNDGANGELDQPADLIVYKDKLVISNFDLMVQKGMLNSKHSKPYTLSFINIEN